MNNRESLLDNFSCENEELRERKEAIRKVYDFLIRGPFTSREKAAAGEGLRQFNSSMDQLDAVKETRGYHLIEQLSINERQILYFHETNQEVILSIIANGPVTYGSRN